MRKAWVGISLIFVAFPALAAVQYDFIQHTQSDIAQLPPTNLSGRATVDGARSRVDFISGDLYPPGTYCISTNGSRTITFVDPVMKSFTEFNASMVSAAIGSSNITVENLKSDVTKLDDHPAFAGVSTDHYRLAIDFNITVVFHSMPLRQIVHTEIDKWTTIEYGDIADTFLAAAAIRTGNQQLDHLIDLESTKIKGFPLKQTVKITTTNPQGVAPNSKLGFNPVRTQSRELVITSITRGEADKKFFVVPASFKRNNVQQLAEKSAQTQVTILSFDPQGAK